MPDPFGGAFVSPFDHRIDAVLDLAQSVLRNPTCFFKRHEGIAADHVPALPPLMSKHDEEASFALLGGTIAEAFKVCVP